MAMLDIARLSDGTLKMPFALKLPKPSPMRIASNAHGVITFSYSKLLPINHHNNNYYVHFGCDNFGISSFNYKM